MTWVKKRKRKKKDLILNKENELIFTQLQKPSHLKNKYLNEYNEELLLRITLGVYKFSINSSMFLSELRPSSTASIGQKTN